MYVRQRPQSAGTARRTAAAVLVDSSRKTVAVLENLGADPARGSLAVSPVQSVGISKGGRVSAGTQ